MELVKCYKKYWPFIYSLRKEVKEGFINQDDFSLEEHESFMSKNHKNYQICLMFGCVPAGFIGAIEGDIRVAVSPFFQNQGVGKFMLNTFLEDNKKIQAKVKIENEASLRLFESCGFKKKYYILEK